GRAPRDLSGMRSARRSRSRSSAPTTGRRIPRTPSGRSARSSNRRLQRVRNGRGRTLSEQRLARLFVSPSVTTITLVALFPVLYALAMSLYAYDGRHEEGFAGLANYAAQLTSGDFWRPVNATFVFTISSVCLELVIGLGFALIMNRAPGQHMTRATILVPWV